MAIRKVQDTFCNVNLHKVIILWTAHFEESAEGMIMLQIT